MTRPLLAAYTLAPADPAAESAFYEHLSALDIAGLETPLPPDDGRLADPAWLLQNVAPTHDLLITCVPTVVHRRTLDPAYGLASTDTAGRHRALADVRRACDLARALADRSGRPRVLGIEVQSAPGPDGGDSDALLRSLTEIQGWDRAGARIVLEHCDALVPGQAPQKGFLPLATELATVGALAGDPDAPGIGINWGRSAIEGRSATTPLDHLRAAADSGLLTTLVLSGAAATDGPWGPAWTDAHLPPREDDGAPALANTGTSLLGATEIRAALAAAGSVAHLGIKVTPRPQDGDVASRIALAEATLAVVARAAAGVRRE